MPEPEATAAVTCPTGLTNLPAPPVVDALPGLGDKLSDARPYRDVPVGQNLWMPRRVCFGTELKPSIVAFRTRENTSEQASANFGVRVGIR